MDDELRKIAEALKRLSSRERWLAAVTGGMAALTTALLSWSLALVLVVGRAPRAAILAAAAAALLIGVGAALAWTFTHLRATRDHLRQARAVEALRPELRGRLVTAAERVDGPRGRESASLLALAARRAGAVLDTVDAATVHPATVARRATGVAGLALSLLLALGIALPVGPFDALRMLRGEARAEADDERAEAADASLRETVVGEIALRYVYPEYTRLDPQEILNSNGTAHGPPGTVVTITARTAEVFTSAALQLNESPPTAAELTGGRDLKSRFVIEAPGVWRFILTDAYDAQALSPDFEIEVEQDLPPTVELDVPSERLTVPWKDKIPISWSARDDYGVLKVAARIDGEADKEVTLRAPLDPVSSLRGSLGKTPADLGLKPGDQVMMEIVAWDNDEYSGSKAGKSRKVKVVVMGPRGEARRVFEFRRELRDALVDVLAGFVTDPSPPAQEQASLSRWGEGIAGRFDPLDVLVDKYWDAMGSGSLESLIIDEVRRQGGGMLRFVQVIADPRSQERADARDLVTLADMRGELVEQVETAVLMLDKMVRISAMRELNEVGRQVSGAAESVEARALAGALGPELQARMSVLERLEPKLLRAAADLTEGPTTALVLRTVADADLIEARISELAADPDADPDELLRLVNLLADVYRHLEAQLEHMQQEAEEENQEMEDRIQELIEELERLEAEERDLQQRTREAREANSGGSEALVNAWSRVETLSEQLSERTAKMAEEQKEDDKGFFGSLAGASADQAARLRRAIKARDLDDARNEAYRARARVEQALRNQEFARALDPDTPAANPTENLQARSEVSEIERVLENLDALMNSATPALRQATGQLNEEQDALIAPTILAQGEAGSISRELPMGAPGLNESMEGAVREMSRSQSALEQARAVEAEGAEGAAADHIRQAIEALSQAASALQQMEAAMQPAGEGSGESDGGDSEEGPNTRQDVEIPAPEEFRTPEEYRRALLEGMQADVPPEYRALKRRYYEELVRQ